MSAHAWLAVGLAVATAFFYALSNVLELLEAEQVPDEHALKLSLIGRLIRRPRWLLGLLSDVFGYLCQAAALGLAAVIFVEPILATGILMALLLGALFTRRRIEGREWGGAVALSIGLAVFLYEVSPTGGNDVASLRRWLLVAPAIIVSAGGALLVAQGQTGTRRAASLGVSAGVLFGVSALLTKSLMHYFGNGIFGFVPHWEPYALAFTAIGGVVIAQSAFQTGKLAASVGTTEALGPVSAAVLGLLLLNEHVSVDSPAQALAVLISIALMLWGVATLARAEERILAPEITTTAVT